MQKIGNILEFTTELFLERSITPTREPLGECQNDMQMYINESKSKGAIDWNYLGPDGSEGGAGIGLWFENNTLVDYDGVFELPKEAIKLIRSNGFRVPREFE